MTSSNRRTVIAVIAFALAGAGGVVYVARAMDAIPRPDLEKWSAITIGRSADEIRGLLGEPRWQYPALISPAEYCLSGYGCQDRPVSGAVYLYMGADMVLYVRFDAAMRVEATFVGGS
jgi:hypothetical protein